MYIQKEREKILCCALKYCKIQSGENTTNKWAALYRTKSDIIV